MTTTQVPIIAWEKRYMTVRECARLQCMDELEHFPKVPTRAFKALGNGVNAHLVELIAEALIDSVPAGSRIATTTPLRLEKDPYLASTSVTESGQNPVSLVAW